MMHLLKKKRRKIAAFEVLKSTCNEETISLVGLVEKSTFSDKN